MKVRINLTIEDSLLSEAKRYAADHKTSVSSLVEDYFKKIARPHGRENIIEMLDEMEAPEMDLNKNLIKDFYEERSGKYGF